MELLVASLIVLAAPLQAQQPPAAERPWRDVELRLGGFIASMDAGVAIKSGAGVGATFDVEDALDLDESIRSLRLGASLALGDRHRLHFDFFDLSRDSSTRLGQAIQIGDTVYPIGTDVETEIGLQLYNLTYGYSILQDDRFDIAVTFGIHGLRTNLEFEAAGIGADASERFFLPIPLPGLRADFVLTSDLWLRHRVEILWFNLDLYRMLLVDSSVGLEYALFEHVAIGLAYNTFNFHLEMEEDEYPAVQFEGEVEFSFSGVLLYLNVFF